jgi:hypothetical protein
VVDVQVLEVGGRSATHSNQYSNSIQPRQQISPANPATIN